MNQASYRRPLGCFLGLWVGEEATICFLGPQLLKLLRGHCQAVSWDGEGWGG